MADEIQPALTAEEWGILLETRRQGLVVPPLRFLHFQAAVSLYGQPFGFTREDVNHLHQSAELLDREGWDEEVTFCRSLAARIAALLPPNQ